MINNFKNQIANKYGYADWATIDWYNLNCTNNYPINGYYAEDILLNEAIELYVKYREIKAVWDYRIATLKPREKAIFESLTDTFQSTADIARNIGDRSGNVSSSLKHMVQKGLVESRTTENRFLMWKRKKH